ncbi:glycoprotein E49 [Elephant endotheliotropic herpesvirus 1A]|uniref:Membrane glycoprotein E49 n=2 Tax=Elephant endotheliotropic herpesvirus 1A TaxID=759753 RepID=A0A866VT03_ELHV1|nr:membrane glycoprotein E49 [Elephant endotheliotropic herpesvirus 1A]AYF58473.1 E49 membrane glycoprotein [Elephant endotheliotropic herpesvirus 1B]AYF58482.1 membrane glycoprotein E49 [Elephant endotheliotropic herpesvirus 1A]QOE74514.1 membrane glycoprotein E49 [Elephant endotheliotropic herpesvirus 1A]QYM88427.1 glycoprotein E49 [Elephant endotheliotropic herpesvirus 1A]
MGGGSKYYLFMYMCIICRAQNFCSVDDYGITNTRNITLNGMDLHNVTVTLRLNYTGTHTLFHNNTASHYVSNGTHVTLSTLCNDAAGTYVLQTQNDSVVDCQFFDVNVNCTITLSSIATTLKNCVSVCEYSHIFLFFVLSLCFYLIY